MTVREAFEKAGYPVPEGANIYFHHEHWVSPWAGDSLIFYDFNARWVFDPLGTANDKNLINLSNLPAIDAYNALPDVVKAVVPR